MGYFSLCLICERVRGLEGCELVEATDSVSSTSLSSPTSSCSTDPLVTEILTLQFFSTFFFVLFDESCEGGRILNPSFFLCLVNSVEILHNIQKICSCSTTEGGILKTKHHVGDGGLAFQAFLNTGVAVRTKKRVQLSYSNKTFERKL